VIKNEDDEKKKKKIINSKIGKEDYGTQSEP